MAEEIKFEKALEQLEKIVEDLESGNIPLEEALKKYEEGVRLSRACQQKLHQAEKKIEILTKTLDGSLKKEPFDLEAAENTEGASSKKAKRTQAPAKDKAAGDEDMLF